MPTWDLNMLEVLSPVHSGATLSVAAMLLSTVGGVMEVPAPRPFQATKGSMTFARLNEQRTISSSVVRTMVVGSVFDELGQPRPVSRAEDVALRRAALRSSRVISRGRFVTR